MAMTATATKVDRGQTLQCCGFCEHVTLYNLKKRRKKEGFGDLHLLTKCGS